MFGNGEIAGEIAGETAREMAGEPAEDCLIKFNCLFVWS